VNGLDIVVVSYNTRDLLAECLQSLRDHPYRGPQRVQVIDNASPDESVALVRGKFPEVDLCVMPVNRGFGRAANHGLRHLKHEFVLLLNADACVAPDTLNILMDHLERHPEDGAVGPAQCGPDGRRQCTWGDALTLHSEWQRRRRHRRLGPGDIGEAAPVERAAHWVSGSAVLIRREALRRAGLFDEGFFLYFEDIDLCRRIGAAGYAVRFLPAARVVHHGGAAARTVGGLADFEYRRSQLRFWRKHAGPLPLLLVRLWIAGKYGLIWLARRAGARGDRLPPRDHACRVVRLALRKGLTETAE